MSFPKLPANSEQLLLELVEAENPAQVLCDRLQQASGTKEQELRSVIRELRSQGYLTIHWANNLPYIVTLNNAAHTYREELSINMQREKGDAEHPVVFISHRSLDKDVADALVDFLSNVGVPKEVVFCSSLPGNDVKEKISTEVKKALKKSVLNIAILSQDYYQSAYCLNEAGVLWYEEVTVIPIALPEISESNMYGFLNSEYKLRRLDSDADVSYIYDAVQEAVSAKPAKAEIFTYESGKLKDRYFSCLETKAKKTPTVETAALSDITTDDERIVLYYMLQNRTRKITKFALIDWLQKNEIHGVNVDNAFDLLSSLSGGAVTNETLEFGIETFRKFSGNAEVLIGELQPYVLRHQKLAKERFDNLVENSILDLSTWLLLAYIVDERVFSLGSRWRATEQVESIAYWEKKNGLATVLSSDYGKSLSFLIENGLVYESDWTSYGNPREYSLYPSLQSYLDSGSSDVTAQLKAAKDRVVLPF